MFLQWYRDNLFFKFYFRSTFSFVGQDEASKAHHCRKTNVVVHLKELMKQIFCLILLILSCAPAIADIAPNPIVVNSIYTIADCKIQMTSEYVFADIYNDSAKVECTFNLENFGDATEIQIGFPEMNFQYWSMGEYTPTDRGNFSIYVDERLLTEKDIQVPAEMDSVYRKYMAVYHFDNEYQRKRDSIYAANGIKEKGNRTIYPPGTYQKTQKALQDLFEWRESKPSLGSKLWIEFKEQQEKGNFPWYVWNVKFDRQAKRQIKIVYTLPSGLGYGGDFRYFNYILRTGSGWYKSIGKASIKIQLHDIDIETIEQVAPSIFSIDSTQKTIQWTFTDLEPTAQDDIYLRYYNKAERRKWDSAKRRRKRGW